MNENETDYDVDVGDHVEVVASQNTVVEGIVDRFEFGGIIVEPEASGVVVEWSIMPDDTLHETRWDGDDPSENEIGVVREVNVRP